MKSLKPHPTDTIARHFNKSYITVIHDTQERRLEADEITLRSSAFQFTCLESSFHILSWFPPLRATRQGSSLVQDNNFSILLVEDHPFQLIATQMQLNRLGFFRLAPVLDAAEAREACARRSKPFDLLLCDINLPGTDGIELVCELADAGSIRQAVLLSGREEEELHALQHSLRARGIPVLACLAKPLDQGALLQALEAEDRSWLSGWAY